MIIVIISLAILLNCIGSRGLWLYNGYIRIGDHVACSSKRLLVGFSTTRWPYTNIPDWRSKGRVAMARKIMLWPARYNRNHNCWLSIKIVIKLDAMITSFDEYHLHFIFMTISAESWTLHCQWPKLHNHVACFISSKVLHHLHIRIEICFSFGSKRLNKQKKNKNSYS